MVSFIVTSSVLSERKLTYPFPYPFPYQLIWFEIRQSTYTLQFNTSILFWRTSCVCKIHAQLMQFEPIHIVHHKYTGIAYTNLVIHQQSNFWTSLPIYAGKFTNESKIMNPKCASEINLRVKNGLFNWPSWVNESNDIIGKHSQLSWLREFIQKDRKKTKRRDKIENIYFILFILHAWQKPLWKKIITCSRLKPNEIFLPEYIVLVCFNVQICVLTYNVVEITQYAGSHHTSRLFGLHRKTWS